MSGHRVPRWSFFDHRAQDRGSVGVGPFLDRLDGTGNRAVNRHTQTFVIADLLTYGHGITLLHKALAGGANVLGHGDHQNIGFGEGLYGLGFGVGLVFFGMHAAEKGKSHRDLTS